MLFNEGYLEKAAIGWILTEKPRIMQEELLAKFKEEHGEIPVWNTKKKLAVKTKETPAFKPKEKAAPAQKPKLLLLKSIAKKAQKPAPKTKVVSTKKTAAKEETPAKTEMPAKRKLSQKCRKGKKRNTFR